MTIKRGNFYDSRKGNHSYSMWTSGYDVCIDGKYFYQLRNYEKDIVSIIPPVEINGGTEIQWNELNTEIKKQHFKTIHPEGSEREMNLFIYGEIEGSKINSRNEWADKHLVHNREITLRICKKIGEFENVEFVKSISCWPGTGYKDYIYIIDNKWQVSVSANGYYLEDYNQKKEKKKVFGKKVSRLAKQAGVPWKIAVFVGEADEEEAISILEQVKSARGTANAELQWELSCGINRRTKALEELLGETWKKLNCSGQNRTTTLANYLLEKDL